MKQHVVMTAKEIDSAIKKMAGDIIEDIADLENVVFIGIVTRGVCIANRLIQEIKKKEQRDFLMMPPGPKAVCSSPIVSFRCGPAG